MARVLVASDSEIARDPRVARQVLWLESRGHVVDTVGRGTGLSKQSGRHFSMPRRPLAVRLLTYLFLPNRARYEILVGGTVPDELQGDAQSSPYDAVVLNEIELLPWFIKIAPRIASAHAKIHLDLHEFSPGQGQGLVYHLLFKRWRKFLISFIPSGLFTSRTTVAEGIAELYEELFDIPRPIVVRNCPAYEELSSHPVSGDRVRLVHHGVAAASRRLDLLIDAMAFLPENYSLELMLIGTPDKLNSLKSEAARVSPRITFRDPVPVTQIARALNEYDAEVIFYPPTTQNLKFALPNKLFEAVQGRIALITGDSPEMANVIRTFGNGAVVAGWTARDLAAGILELTPAQLSSMKKNSEAAAQSLSSEHEAQVFLTAVGLDA
jgi:glycosyltransferase involved in cell wall biosynthesis